MIWSAKVKIFLKKARLENQNRVIVIPSPCLTPKTPIAHTMNACHN
jgi:hypothetical protein